MPVWLITGRMATDTLACTVFALIAAVFTALSLRELVLRYSVRARLLTLCAAVPATLAASMVFTMQASANFYTVPVICGMAFLTIFIYLSLRAHAPKGCRYGVRFLRPQVCRLPVCRLPATTRALRCRIVTCIFWCAVREKVR